ncbi:programmed cell death protein 2 isoform X3 [Rhinoderma darwinii]|uniref:programmed cell death protein 2 isoform X3 n=1 Tax=Rhinoderma darwinii TaxID=43563 RepID=UPI003F678725
MRPTRSDSMLHTMMAASVTVTELGFLQECQLWRLRSPHFPSKVGGRPAWLGEVGVPGPENLQCGVCMKPLAFLLQVYAPCTGSFHRTIFLFTCRDPVCHRVAENRCYKDVHSVEVAEHGFLFPEYELVTEPEELDSDASPDDNSTMSQMDVESTTSNVSSNLESSMDDLKLNEDELTALAKHENEEDKAFSRFKKQISIEPDQVLRYCKGGEPLWISLQYVPAENDILNCECGAKRAFEFQVMPQLLNHLKVDSLQKSIDWGVLAVYTCSANCKAETRYVQEFLWKQDVPADTM